MKFAKIDGIRCEATKSGQRGICPGCGAKVVARCGRVKVNHWAHLSGKDCDSWHEPETEWHRMWKNQFPLEWQEKDFVDKATGEHHRADVHTPDGLTIEFQHSAIKPEEREAREFFYKKIIWIVDGSRLKNDWPRFFENQAKFTPIPLTNFPQIFIASRRENIFPKSWTNSSCPVFFDFLGTNQPSSNKDARNFLYCLLPQLNMINDAFFTFVLSKNLLKELCNKGTLYPYINSYIKAIQNKISYTVNKTKRVKR